MKFKLSSGKQLLLVIGALVVVAALAGSGTVSYAALLGGKVLHGNNTLTSRPSLIVTPDSTAGPLH